MILDEIMTPELVTIDPDATLQQAGQLMMSLDVGLLPVVADDDLVGVITDRDITIRATARGLDPKRTPVRLIMTEAAICGSNTQDISQGAQQMMEHQIRRLPILDIHQRLVGIVSLSDLVKAFDDKRLAAEVLLRISETTVPAPLPRG